VSYRLESGSAEYKCLMIPDIGLDCILPTHWIHLMQIFCLSANGLTESPTVMQCGKVLAGQQPTGLQWSNSAQPTQENPCLNVSFNSTFFWLCSETWISWLWS